jgi:cardiolipin synthase (CMP-forming)
MMGREKRSTGRSRIRRLPSLQQHDVRLMLLPRICFRSPVLLRRAPPYYFHEPRFVFPSGRSVRSVSLPSRYFSVYNPRRTEQPPPSPKGSSVRENIYTFPNLLTVSRILACPVLGWSILESNFYLATSLLVYAGVTDLVRTFC